MRKFILSLIDSDNRSVEAHLVLLCVGAVALIALSVYHVVILKQAFEPSTYGEGLGYLLAGGGAAAWGEGLCRGQRKRRDNEPHP